MCKVQCGESSMKKIVVGIVLMGALLAFSGADTRSVEQTSPAIIISRKPCYGYTIIEFGKGIDCHGDTVRLVKVKGGQERLRSSMAPTEATSGSKTPT